MIEAVGWVAGILFAFCAFPQAYQSYKSGHSVGINPWLLWMWWLGEVLMIIYVYVKHGFDVPLMINYIGNLFFLAFIMKFYYFPRQPK